MVGWTLESGILTPHARTAVSGRTCDRNCRSPAQLPVSAQECVDNPPDEEYTCAEQVCVMLRVFWSFGRVVSWRGLVGRVAAVRPCGPLC